MKDTVRAWFAEGAFLRSVSVLAGGTVVAQGATLLVSPVVTRLYEPEAFGRFGIIASFLAIVAAGVTAKYDAAIVNGEDRDEAALLLAGAVGITAILLLPTWLTYSILITEGVFGFGELPSWSVVLVLPAVFFMALFTSLRYWLIREGNFEAVTNATVRRGVVRAVAQVGLGFVWAGWIGLMVAEVASRCAGLVKMLRVSWDRFKKALLPLHPANLYATLRDHYRYPLYALPSSLLDIVALNLTVPVVYELFDGSSAGHFALVQRVVSAPLVVVGSSVADAFHNRTADMRRERPADIPGLFFRTAFGLFGFSLVGAVVLLFVGPPAFSFVFGSKWGGAGLLAASMAPWFVGQLTVSPLSRIIFVLDGQRLKLVYDILALSSLGVMYIVAIHMQLEITEFILLLSVLNFVAYSVYFGLLWRLVRRRIPA